MTLRCFALALLVVTLGATPGAWSPAAGIVGDWEGEVKTPASFSPLPIYMSYSRADDGRLTGVAGMARQDRSPIEELAEHEGSRFTGRVKLRTGLVLSFDLKLEGDRLSGTVGAREGDATWTGTAALSRAGA